MTIDINVDNWLVEFDMGGASGPPDITANQSPESQPGGPGDPMNQAPPTDQAIDQSAVADLSDDPEYPEMPEEDQSEKDFETWKMHFVKESIKGDPYKMLQMLRQIRDRELDEYPLRFVENNVNICLLRQNSNIFEASTEVRKLLKKDFDRTNPATSVISHITEVLDRAPLLNEVYIKMLGLGACGGDQHRKFIGALLGAVQVGNGQANEDLVFEETDYSIRISTRFNSKWGGVNIGSWSLKEDDPERYLKEAELNLLESGSPEEKDVMRRRVIRESIAEQFRERAFVINAVGSDGTVQHLGCDVGNCVKSAFSDGKLVVRMKDSDTKNAFIDEEGSIVPIPNIGIYYIREAPSLGSEGKPEIEEIEFMIHKEGKLYLTAQLDVIKEAAVSLQGMIYRETPWQGNPSDIQKIMRQVPTSPEMLLRQS